MFFFFLVKLSAYLTQCIKAKTGRDHGDPSVVFLPLVTNVCVCLCVSERERLSDREVVWLCRLYCVYSSKADLTGRKVVFQSADISSGTCTFYCLLVLTLCDLAFSVPSRARQLHACVSVHISHIV